MKKGHSRIGLYLRVVMINLGVAVMFLSLSFDAPQSTAIYNYYPKPQAIQQDLVNPIKYGIPNRLVIKSLGLDLDVATGYFDESIGDWVIDDTKAFYADVSMPSNDKSGVTLIYGHAKWPIFGNLGEIKPKATAAVTTDTGYQFNYVYQSVKQVVPTDVSVFQEKGDPKLVLQTCSGPWDMYRSLFSFTLESVTKL